MCPEQALTALVAGLPLSLAQLLPPGLQLNPETRHGHHPIPLVTVTFKGSSLLWEWGRGRRELKSGKRG